MRTWVGMLPLCLCLLAGAASARNGDVVYQANVGGTDQLFHIDARTDAITVLNGPLVAGGGVDEFVVGPKGKSVLYLADADTDQLFELYLVDLKTRAVTKVNAPLAPGRRIRSDRFRFGPKGKNVFYIADQDTQGVDEVYRFEPRKGRRTKLNGPVTDSIPFFLSAPNGKSLIYFADAVAPDGFELYQVGLRTNTPALLPFDASPIFDLDWGVRSKTIFTRFQNPNGSRDLVRFVLKTGEMTMLNDPLIATGSLVPQVGPKGRVVVYAGDQDTEGVDEIYSVQLKSGVVTKLNPPLIEGGDVDFFRVEIGPKGKGALYFADQDTDEVQEVYWADLRKGGVRKLNGPIVTGGRVVRGSIDPKGKFAVYIADQDTDEVFELYRVDIKSGAVTKLNEALDPDDDVAGFEIGPKGKIVVYRQTRGSDATSRLHRVDLKSGAVETINPSISTGFFRRFAIVGARRPPNL